jgi:hypothetical protein
MSFCSIREIRNKKEMKKAPSEKNARLEITRDLWEKSLRSISGLEMFLNGK